MYMWGGGEERVKEREEIYTAYQSSALIQVYVSLKYF